MLNLCFRRWLLLAATVATITSAYAAGENWPLEAIAQPPAKPGIPVTVAIIDSGLDFQHPDLARANIWINDAESGNSRDDDNNGYVDDIMGWDFVDEDNNPWDDYGHGTFVAGIIGATRDNGIGIDGVTNNVRLMPLRVLNNAGYGGQIAFARAMFYAVANGAQVINLSLGDRSVSALDRMLIDYARAQGVVVVVAAGNLGIDVAQFGPANVASALVVGAIDSDRSHPAFSNTGANVAVVAPGSAVVSLRARRTDFNLVSRVSGYQAGADFLGEDAQTYRSTGTSFAAPFVAGLAAELLSRNSALSADDVHRLITQSAVDVHLPGVDLTSGYGLINMEAALTADPAYFVTASIRGVEIVQTAAGVGAQVLGVATADRFRRAVLSIGRGSNPSRWESIDKRLPSQPTVGELGVIPAKRLKGSKQWTLRLEVVHRDGSQRESRFLLEVD